MELRIVGDIVIQANRERHFRTGIARENQPAIFVRHAFFLRQGRVGHQVEFAADDIRLFRSQFANRHRCINCIHLHIGNLDHTVVGNVVASATHLRFVSFEALHDLFAGNLAGICAGRHSGIIIRFIAHERRIQFERLLTRHGHIAVVVGRIRFHADLHGRFGGDGKVIHQVRKHRHGVGHRIMSPRVTARFGREDITTVRIRGDGDATGAAVIQLPIACFRRHQRHFARLHRRRVHHVVRHLSSRSRDRHHREQHGEQHHHRHYQCRPLADHLTPHINIPLCMIHHGALFLNMCTEHTHTIIQYNSIPNLAINCKRNFHFFYFGENAKNRCSEEQRFRFYERPKSASTKSLL